MERDRNGVTAIPTRDELIGMFDQCQRRHPIQCHPYIDFVCDGHNNDPASVNRFVEVVYRVTEALRDCRLAIAAETRDESIRVALIEDLHREYCGGVHEDSRAFVMRKLLASLGYTEFTPIRLNEETQGIVNRISDYGRDEPSLKAIGCVWLGAERSRIALFQKVYDAFKRKGFLQAVDLSAFDVRPEDVARASRAIEVVEPFMSGPEGRSLLHQGLLASKSLFDELWASSLRRESKHASTAV
jgi:hypothetical protein